MNIAYLLVLLGLGAFVIAIWAMFWAIDSGQYDDLESEGRSILDDESGNGDSPHLLAKGAAPGPGATS